MDTLPCARPRTRPSPPPAPLGAYAAARQERPSPAGPPHPTPKFGFVCSSRRSTPGARTFSHTTISNNSHLANPLPLPRPLLALRSPVSLPHLCSHDAHTTRVLCPSPYLPHVLYIACNTQHPRVGHRSRPPHKKNRPTPVLSTQLDRITCGDNYGHATTAALALARRPLPVSDPPSSSPASSHHHRRARL